MKKIGFLFLSIFILAGCQKKPESILSKVLNDIVVSSEITEDINLPTEFKYKSNKISAVWESSKPDILSNNGKVTKTSYKEKIKLKVTLTLGEATQTKEFEFYVLPMNETETIIAAQNKIQIISETKSDINLPTNINGVSIAWSSSNPEALNELGVVGEVTSVTEVTLTAKFNYRNSHETKNYLIKVIPLSREDKLHNVISEIDLQERVILSNLDLTTSFPYGITATWESSDETVLSNQGIVTLGTESRKVTLILKLNLEGETMTKTYNLTVGKQIDFAGHSYLERVNDFDKNNFNNVHIINNKLILKDEAIEGSYESNMIMVPAFASLVASWSAISGVDHTVELLVKVMVDNEWSDYLSYQPWGLGLQNTAINQTSSNNIAKLTDDELKINNNKLASAIQYKVILRRITTQSKSPELSLISMALEINGYSYEITDTLPDFVDYEVPQLNQNIVPVIGNSICSPTSITMLLKYKGHSFLEFDEYEHRYIAKLAYDYGNNIYGNWVFNTVTASAFTETAYVKRMYSFKELQHHLKTVGPVAASVKGDMQGKYTTNGHLIVVRGYRVTPEKTYVITNDPNLKDVYFEYDLETFINVWRNIIYVIE